MNNEPSSFLINGNEETHSSIEDALEYEMDYNANDEVIYKVNRWVEIEPVWVSAHWPQGGKLVFTEHATKEEAEAAHEANKLS